MDKYTLRKHFDEIFFQENSKNQHRRRNHTYTHCVRESWVSSQKSDLCHTIKSKWLLTLDSPNEQSNSSNIDLIKLSQRAPSTPRRHWHI